MIAMSPPNGTSIKGVVRRRPLCAPVMVMVRIGIPR